MFTKLIKLSASTLLAASLLSGAAYAQGGGYQWNQSVASTTTTATTTASQVNGAPVAPVSANAIHTLQVGETAPGTTARYSAGTIAATHPNNISQFQNGLL